MPSRTRTPPSPSRARSRTLWEEGHHPGRLVVRVALVATAGVAGGTLLLDDQLGVPFDLAFVAVCVGAALWVRPRDFYLVGVLPPLLLTGTVVVLAVAHRTAVARPEDSFGQAVVSGLAHHAIALSVGYALTLLVIGLRQVALRNAGIIRAGAIKATATPPRGG